MVFLRKELVGTFLALMLICQFTIVTAFASEILSSVGTIEGQIISSEGIPIAGAIVYATTSFSSMEAIQSDSNGFFKIINKSPDIYDVYFYMNDWSYSGKISNVIVQAGQTSTVNFLNVNKRPPSEPPVPTNITVTNNPAGSLDTVTVTGLRSDGPYGGVVRVYDSPVGGKLLGEIAYNSQTYATMYIQQLGQSANLIYVSTIYANQGFSESLRVQKPYDAEIPVIVDVQAPTLQKVEIDKTDARSGDTVTVYVTASDELSGLNQALIFFMQAGIGHSTLLNNLDEQGRFVGHIVVPHNAPSGKWIIDMIDITDKQGNSSRFIHGIDYQAEFTVIGDVPAEGVQFSPSKYATVNVNQPIDLIARTKVLGTVLGDSWYYTGLIGRKFSWEELPPEISNGVFVDRMRFIGFIPGVYIFMYGTRQEISDGSIVYIPGTQVITVTNRPPDTTAPITLISLSPAMPNGTNGWFTINVTTTLSASDNESGINNIEYRINNDSWSGYTGSFDITNEGHNTVEYRSTDKAGNIETAKSKTVDIDKSSPVTMSALSPSLANGLNGWFTHNVSLSLTAVDTTSGVAKTEYSIDSGSTWQIYTKDITFDKSGKYNIKFRSQDKAGNVEEIKTIAFNVDNTAPSIYVSAPLTGDYYDSADVMPQITITDDTSGVDNTKTKVTIDEQNIQQHKAIPLYTLPLGIHTFSVSVSDVAGNLNVFTVTFVTKTNLDSLKTLVTRFTNEGWIEKLGIAKSLQKKLEHGDLGAFISEVKAQSGKGLSEETAKYLIRDAQAI